MLDTFHRVKKTWCSDDAELDSLNREKTCLKETEEDDYMAKELVDMEHVKKLGKALFLAMESLEGVCISLEGVVKDRAKEVQAFVFSKEG